MAKASERPQRGSTYAWIGMAAAVSVAGTSLTLGQPRAPAASQQGSQQGSQHGGPRSAQQGTPAAGPPRAPIEAGLDGTSPARWLGLGAADWRVDKGDVVGTVRGTGGGWLVQARRYQDLGVKFWFQCADECETGILLGREEAGDRSTGLYVSLTSADLEAYEMTLDAQGQEIRRDAPAPPEGADATAAAGGGRGGGQRGTGQALAPPAGHPMSVPPPTATVRRNDWNQVEVRLFTEVNATAPSLSVLLNGVIVNTGYPIAPTGPGFGRTDRIAFRPQMGRFGPLALRVSGKPGAEARFKNIAILDYTSVETEVDEASNRFRVQHVTRFFHGDGSCVGDLDRDGTPDIVAGLVAWFGPDFTKGRTIDVTFPLTVTDYGSTLSCGIADFTGDGWPDVVQTSFPGGGPAYLYVNPQNGNRRWPRHKVVEGGLSEIVVFVDIDGDGRTEIVYGGEGYAVNYAKPDPADPLKPWTVHHLTERAAWGPHGLGVGDVNGDGRLDVLRGWGWWEHPADPAQTPWTFHPETFGRTGRGAGGGAQLEVYDVNGDGLNDVVTSLAAHAYGLAWFEQKRDQAGSRSFVQHLIMDRDPAQSHGVAFSEMHGLTLADVDGDGLKDIVTGKHRDHNFEQHYSYSWAADEDADNVFYWFKLARKAGGAVDFVPHLIHNGSGGGRQPMGVDLNGDGVLDVLNSGRFGTMVFYGKKGAADDRVTSRP